MENISININRLTHLLSLYGLSKDDLLSRVSDGLKKPLVEKDVFRNEISLNVLKRIDKVFGKGLSYYVDPGDLKMSKDESIFFRKDHFNGELNFAARKIVNQFEEESLTLSVYSKLSNFKVPRLLPVYSLNDDPAIVAEELRKRLYPKFDADLRSFLKSIIERLAEFNVLVFEFVETWNKKEKANIDGFYIKPAVIALKRQQQSFRREIFTLLHEFGHYLLLKEEIDQVVSEDLSNYNSLSQLERWCSNFAYYFLAGNENDSITNMEVASVRNDYQLDLIETLSAKTHLSIDAFYTRMLLAEKISFTDYRRVIEGRHKAYLESIQNKLLDKQMFSELEHKKFGIVPKPIISPLFMKITQLAYIERVINDMDFCKMLHINPNQIESYLP